MRDELSAIFVRLLQNRIIFTILSIYVEKHVSYYSFLQGNPVRNAKTLLTTLEESVREMLTQLHRKHCPEKVAQKTCLNLSETMSIKTVAEREDTFQRLHQLISVMVATMTQCQPQVLMLHILFIFNAFNESTHMKH